MNTELQIELDMARAEITRQSRLRGEAESRVAALQSEVAALRELLDAAKKVCAKTPAPAGYIEAICAGDVKKAKKIFREAAVVDDSQRFWEHWTRFENVVERCSALAGKETHNQGETHDV